jgi:polyphosphate:AMP phosphotransferase
MRFSQERFRMLKTPAPAKRLSDAAFRKRKDALRLDLLDIQQRVRAAGDFPVVVVLAGVRGAGIIDTLNLINTWMDPRWIASFAADRETEEEREQPPFWRYWRALPAKGTIGVYLGGWYSDPIAAFCSKQNDRARFNARLRHIAAFERTLADDGALIVKIWLHLDIKHHRAADEHRPDRVLGFRASDAAWAHHADYSAYVAAAEVGLKATHDKGTQWHVIDGSDDNYRRATVLALLRDQMRRQLKQWKKQKGPPNARKPRPLAAKSRLEDFTPLDTLDLTKTLSDADYHAAFTTQQQRLYDAQKAAHTAGLSTIIAFEGTDAAGKGGAIRRLTYSLSAYNYHVVPISQPTDEEYAHHYLWRFWRHLPRPGHITIFDRSWYGRVLVERVEKLIRPPVWMRAYREINQFEAALIEHGVLVLKFWLHIDRKEQRQRLKERRDTPWKRWKLTDDDWRAYKKWDDYVLAADDMLAETSTPGAPWNVIPAQSKHYARIAVLTTVADRLEAALKARKKA